MTLPTIYDRVLVFGGGSPPTDGPPIAKIGGFLPQPDYGLSYLLAARYVIQSGQADRRQNEVALPTAYLQRHAFEIALKDLRDQARRIKVDYAWLAALRLDSKAAAPNVPKLKFEHDLATLLAQVGTALAEIDYGDVPPEFAELVDRMAALERSDPTRVRYATGKDGKTSFPSPVEIPVGETQERLEQLFAKHLHWNLGDDGEALGAQLSQEGQYLAQELYRYEPD
jgi:hypothetical protein